MNKEFSNLLEFITCFKNEKTCVDYFTAIRYKDGEYCPHCGNSKIYKFESGKRYRCASCKKDFTIITNTIFGESKISLQKWFIAIYLLTSSKKGISSIQLSKQVGVTQKTAWFMDHRIRKAMKNSKLQLFGNIEIDETYIGGKEKNKHRTKRVAGTQGRNTKEKTPVIGLLERKGKVVAEVREDVTMRTVESAIVRNVQIGSQLFTDDFRSYGRIGKLFTHHAVEHSSGEYVRDGYIHTNSIESFWSLFKRGYYGTYHYMSRKHLQRYVDEFSYRFNMRSFDIDKSFSDMVLRTATASKLNYKLLTR